MLLPSRCLPRRHDEVTTIGQALQAHAAGQGHRPIAASLGLPEDTVRGWLRAARARAEQLRRLATGLLVQLDPLYPPIEPRRSVFADAIEALGRVTAAAVLRLGLVSVPPWQLIAVWTSGRLLSAPTRT